jgi:Holliday junction resolvase RusA-like endonuclease
VTPRKRQGRLTFTIPGRPIPLERARVVQKTLASGQRSTRSHTPAKSSAYRSVVQIHMKLAWAAVKDRWPWRTPSPLSLSLWIYWADGHHGDGSNLLKAIEDAGNGLLWEDDKQITQGHFYCTIDRERPRVVVRAELLEVGACRECEIWSCVGKPCPAHDDGRGLEVVR